MHLVLGIIHMMSSSACISVDESSSGVRGAQVYKHDGMALGKKAEVHRCQRSTAALRSAGLDHVIVSAYTVDV